MIMLGLKQKTALMNCSNYNKILHLLAGVALGYLIFGCKSSKPNCDAYSSNNKKPHENTVRK